MRILQRAWSVLLVVPIITVTVISLMDFLVYPLLTHEEFHILIGPLTAVKFTAVLTAFIVPYLVARIYKVSFANLIAFWILLTGIGLVTDTGSYEGNQNDGLAFHIFVYQFGAMIATLIFTLIQNRRRNQSVV